MKFLLSFISILALSLQCASAISSLTLDTLSFKTLVNGTTINDFPIVSADGQTLGFDSAMRGTDSLAHTQWRWINRDNQPFIAANVDLLDGLATLPLRRNS